MEDAPGQVVLHADMINSVDAASATVEITYHAGDVTLRRHAEVAPATA